MKKQNKPLIIIALCLIGAGLLICTGVMAVLGFDFTKLDNSVYVESTYEFSHSKITDVIIDTKNTDIKILPSTDGKAKVVCYDNEDDKYITKVKDGILSISKQKKEWYEYIMAFNFKSSRITIYLPQSTYSSIQIDNSTGDIFIDSINTESISIECSTGDISLLNLEAYHTDLETSTGNIELKHILSHNGDIESSTGDVNIDSTVFSGNMEIETSSGDITFNLSDAQSISAETSTGHITGTLLTAKTFYTETSTGAINVPRTTGNICELETSTGNIRISIAE